MIFQRKKPDNKKKLVFSECDIKSLESIQINENKCIQYNLKNIQIKPLSKTLITGESGVGKSILLKTMFYAPRKYTGSILMNHCELENIKDNVPFKNVAFIPQNPYIFNNTLRFNLTLGKNIEESKIKSVLKSLKLDNLLNDSQELNRMISTDGGNISGGEAMRICIARAILMGKDVLVMDEPFAALDAETSLIVAKFVQLLNMTVILTGHRLDKNITQIFTNIIHIEKEN